MDPFLERYSAVHGCCFYRVAAGAADMSEGSLGVQVALFSASSDRLSGFVVAEKT